MSEKFSSKDINVINENYYSTIDGSGQYKDSTNGEIIPDGVSFGDEWTRDNISQDGKTSINSISLSELYNPNDNFFKRDGQDESPSKYIYDDVRGVLTFRDESISKQNEFGCTYPGSEEVTLKDMVRDLEILSAFKRIPDFGSIYDVQVRQVTYGVYKYANALICVNIAKSLGYLSLDKMINDEYITKKSMNDLHEKYKDNDSLKDKYPPYSGWLDSDDYTNGGWVDIDSLIKKELNDEWGYDDTWSLSLFTKKFADRKKALVNLILTYTSNIWGLNSSNKIVDFGLRIIDKTSGKQLDYSDAKNGMQSIIGNVVSVQFSGELGPAQTDENGNAANNQPSETDVCEQKSCDKVSVDKCNNILYKNVCEDVNLGSGSVSDSENGISHFISPQFRLNPLSNYRKDKPDILNTIDPIHWTTGNISQIKKQFPETTKWVDDLMKKFESSSYESQPLNQNRAFHYVGGSFSDGLSSGGFFHQNDRTTGREFWGSRNTYEIWNGTSWRYGGTYALPGRGLGLSGGNSTYHVTAWGTAPTWSLTSGDYWSDEIYPSGFTINGMSDFYEYNNNVWTLLPISPQVNKHSVSGVINASKTGNNATEVSNENFGKSKIPGSNECIEGCASTTKEFIEKMLDGGDATEVTFKNVVSGFCFNGTRGPFVLDGRNYCNDFDDTFIFFSYIYAVKPGKPVLVTNCSYVDNTRKYPIKTVGTCYVGSGTSGIATGGKTCVPILSCGIGDARSNKYNRYFYPDQYYEDYDSIVKYAYEWNGTTWTRREDMPEDVAYHCGVGDTKWSIYWGGLHSSVERASVSMLVPSGCDDWYTLLEAFNGHYNRYGICGFSGEVKYADFANNFYEIQSVVTITSGPNAGQTVTTYHLNDYGGNYTDGHRGHVKQVTTPIKDNRMVVTTYTDGQSYLIDAISGNSICKCSFPCLSGFNSFSEYSVTGDGIYWYVDQLSGNDDYLFVSISASDNIIKEDPKSRTTIRHQNWKGSYKIVDSSIYNYRHVNLCDMIMHNYHAQVPSDGGMLLNSNGNLNNKWIWSTPMPDGVGDNRIILKYSEHSKPFGSGVEVVRSLKNGNVVKMSRAIVSGTHADGMGMVGYGKCSFDVGSISAAPVSAGFDEYHSLPAPMPYEDANTVFPWNIIGNNGKIGPRGCVDMIDLDGNYWFACGSANNKKPEENNGNDYTNTFTIVMVPFQNIDDFNKLVLSRTNMSLAMVSNSGYLKYDPNLNYNRASGISNPNKTARNREAIIETINAHSGNSIFGLYIKMFEYNIGDIRETNNNFATTVLNKQPTLRQLSLPYYDTSYNAQNSKLTIVETYDIVNDKDINCMNCFTCNFDEIERYSGKNWIQHYHEEWAAPYIQHPLAGLVSRESFNVWLTAGDCEQRWGAPIWTTVDDGRVWVNYKKSTIFTNKDRNHLVYAIITTSFAIDDYKDNYKNDIPVLNRYDEFIFNLDEYEDDQFINELINDINKENKKECEEQTNAFVPASVWTPCLSGCASFVTYTNPPYNSDVSMSTNVGCQSAVINGIGANGQDFDPDVGYTEWASNFILEYKTTGDDDFEKSKYFYKYATDEIGSNCIKKREPINDNSLTATSWRRFQDGSGLGGDAPLFNKIDSSFNCNSTMVNFIGQKAFGDTDRAIICGGYAINFNGEISYDHSLWDFFTEGPTFKWNRYVISVEDTINKNYTNRNLSPFYMNGDQTLVDSNLSSILFDISGPLTVERYGQVIFNNTNSVDVEFEAFPEFIVNKDKYSIVLTPSDNVKVWWESKSPGKFTVKCEMEKWYGIVDWKVLYTEEITVEGVNSVGKQESYDQFEEK
jgi:hypothetical protein